RYQLVGGPDWVYEDRYSIHAKAAGDATREQMMKMVQTLLAERFKLSVHRDTREMPIYLLTVAKGGIRAPRSVDGACVQFDPRNPPRPGAPRQPFCGNNLTRVNSWIATAIDMDAAAGALVGVLGRKVINRTGIEGRFDIDVQWTPDQASDGAAASNADAAPSLFTVLQEQLGLKVESSRGPVDVLVIDHVERPTDD
ncbi:MAG TPA: TIGR03435 family protein, partial [Vicinamibacterales bacterium]|nr:TIGR03435 family protein [Vicinamibacterales bacterium]